MKRLSKETILRIHDEMISMYGGQFGIRDENLFMSECVMPYQTFMGQDLFPDIYDKAVRYLFGFASNQVFLDGNKRTAAMVMLVFLALNGVELNISDAELYVLCMQAANKEIDSLEAKKTLIDYTV